MSELLLMLLVSAVGYVVGYVNGRDAEWERQFDRRRAARGQEVSDGGSET